MAYDIHLGPMPSLSQWADRQTRANAPRHTALPVPEHGAYQTLRTRIQRLVRKTICFSKSAQLHDIVIGLFVNRYAFGRTV